MGEKPWEDEKLDLLQRLKLFLEDFSNGLPMEKWLGNAQDRWHYVLAKVVSQLIGDKKMEGRLKDKVEEVKAMTPAEFDAHVEAIEREHNIVIVDEIDRWMQKAKDFFAKRAAKEGAAEAIVREMLARYGQREEGEDSDGEGDGEGEAGCSEAEEEDEEGKSFDGKNCPTVHQTMEEEDSDGWWVREEED